MTISLRLLASQRLAWALPLVLHGCGSAAVPAVTEPTVSSAACPPSEAGTDPRVITLLGNASTSLARGDHSAAVALLRAAASLGPSPLDDPATRNALSAMPLPIAVTPSTTAYDRSADGAVVAFIAQPSALQADSDVATLCDGSPLEWANLATRTRGSLPLAALAVEDRLAPLLALDAEAAAQHRMVQVLHTERGCVPTADACGIEPQEPRQFDIEGGYATSVLLPRRDLCGRLEAISPHGAFAVVALPDVQVGRMGTGICTLPSRLAFPSDSQQLVCVGTRYQVVALADGRIALDAAHDTEAIRIAEDERHAYVRTRDSARVVPLVSGLAEAALAADCRGPAAFSNDGGSLVSVCGTRIDVVTLGANVSTRSLPLDARGLGPLHEQPILAIATNDTVDRIALVFAPSAVRYVGYQRWALLDARGRVAYRVDAADPSPRAEATAVSPLYEPRRATLPVVRSGSDGIYCGRNDREHRGQTLMLDASVGARFANASVVLYARSYEFVPTEFWQLRSGPQQRGGQTRMRLLQVHRMFGAGEWLTTEPATEESRLRLVFEYASTDERGDALDEARTDTPVGPSRWDTPADEDASAVTADLAAFLAASGARTNLRVCPDDLRVVAVLPMPAAESVWADVRTCVQPPPSSPSEDGLCGGGRI